VTYGACCVDDFAAAAMGADLLVHYGHSCLIPVDKAIIKESLYVFVEIDIDVKHFVECVKLNLVRSDKVAIAGTVQFIKSIHAAMNDLEAFFGNEGKVIVPQEKPLSKGEILGCTAPKLDRDIEVIVFLSDGRFHLEALMIQNPGVKRVYKYDPYSKKITLEEYAHKEMMSIREDAIEVAKKAKRFGLILGTLGRQGNPDILKRLEAKFKEKNLDYICVLLSEILPQKLSLFQDIDAWIQIACPRLSIDWGYAYPKPLLTPYEAFVCLDHISWQSVYPMDNYARDGGEWSNYYKSSKDSAENNISQKAKISLKERLQNARKKKMEIEFTN
jgi:2-(3-amino-3-carboxypropyl)histidine synthase